MIREYRADYNNEFHEVVTNGYHGCTMVTMIRDYRVTGTFLIGGVCPDSGSLLQVHCPLTWKNLPLIHLAVCGRLQSPQALTLCLS